MGILCPSQLGWTGNTITLENFVGQFDSLGGGDGAATMVAKKKTSSVDNINARLSLVVKSGKISLGHRTTIKALRTRQGPPQHRAAGSGCALPRAAAPAAPLVVPCPRAGAPPPQFR